jgi:cytoskeletal protein RodZ
MHISRKRVFLTLVAALLLLAANVTLHSATMPQSAQSPGQTDPGSAQRKKKTTDDSSPTSKPATTRATPSTATPAPATPGKPGQPPRAAEAPVAWYG